MINIALISLKLQYRWAIQQQWAYSINELATTSWTECENIEKESRTQTSREQPSTRTHTHTSEEQISSKPHGSEKKCRWTRKTTYILIYWARSSIFNTYDSNTMCTHFAISCDSLQWGSFSISFLCITNAKTSWFLTIPCSQSSVRQFSGMLNNSQLHSMDYTHFREMLQNLIIIWLFFLHFFESVSLESDFVRHL